jgi:hypothetical protein
LQLISRAAKLMKLKDFPQDTRQALKVQSASTCSIGLVLLVLYHRAGLYRQVTLVTNCPRGRLG